MRRKFLGLISIFLFTLPTSCAIACTPNFTTIESTSNIKEWINKAGEITKAVILSDEKNLDTIELINHVLEERPQQNQKKEKTKITSITESNLLNKQSKRKKSKKNKIKNIINNLEFLTLFNSLNFESSDQIKNKNIIIKFINENANQIEKIKKILNKPYLQINKNDVDNLFSHLFEKNWDTENFITFISHLVLIAKHQLFSDDQIKSKDINFRNLIKHIKMILLTKKEFIKFFLPYYDSKIDLETWYEKTKLFIVKNYIIEALDQLSEKINFSLSMYDINLILNFFEHPSQLLTKLTQQSDFRKKITQKLINIIEATTDVIDFLNKKAIERIIEENYLWKINENTIKNIKFRYNKQRNETTISFNLVRNLDKKRKTYKASFTAPGNVHKKSEIKQYKIKSWREI